MSAERPSDKAASQEIMGDTDWQDRVLAAAEHWPDTEQEGLFELVTTGDETVAETARNRIIGRLAVDARFMPTSSKPSPIGMSAPEWRALSMWVGYSPKQAVAPTEPAEIAERLGMILQATNRTLGDIIATGFTKLMQAERQVTEG